MAWAFTPTSLWPWGGKTPGPSNSKSSSSDPLCGGSGTEFHELELVSSPLVCEPELQPSPGRTNRKRRGRDSQQIDREFDLVLVPPDGGCLSESESDDSDWSIGWLEPHCPEFQSNGRVASENSFAVLVPCYGRRRNGWTEASTDRIPGAIDLSVVNSSEENRKYVEDWLSSLQHS